ncbi:aldehyde dehydrogenase [Clostridium senegalense]|uniref:Aldehyde dehydrogenase n=1 Tax=Clostridium senegalense TaxID=1465809 RepID=A0A6M0H6X5_9CLOT|nr:aldehyde dehydrogenase [Clostridium senegalense]NEU06435.1 aldehyde dehydrogenase [Clostridium senegalense]
MDIKELVDIQRNYFLNGSTLTTQFRLTQLNKLKVILQNNEQLILDALYKDLKKSNFEGYATELGIVFEELNHTIKNLKNWMQATKVKSQLAHFPAKCFTYPEPYGVTLIISPWNYPFQLSLAPLIGAIAAGNTVILKPSQKSLNTSKVLTKLLCENFPRELISVVNGGRDANSELLNQKFDYIFFTGSVPVGKVVMEAASKNLTPVTLELGGKSPCIVDKTADLKLTAKRLVWGKFLNAGQTCVAPDYLYVHSSVKEDLIKYMKHYINKFYGPDFKSSKDYPRIIDEKAFDRLVKYLNCGKIEFGGEIDRDELYISPTILNDITFNNTVMTDEIFGPILPVIEFDTLDEVIAVVNYRPKPLALYFFSKDEKNISKILQRTTSGGVCINETIVHVASLYLPFGGVGESGMGKYHGMNSFETFSHIKSIVKKDFAMDVPLRYPPFTSTKFAKLKKIFK